MSIDMVGGRFVDILPRSFDTSINPANSGTSFFLFGSGMPRENGETSFLSNGSSMSSLHPSWAWTNTTASIGEFSENEKSTYRMYVPIFKGRIEYATSLSQFTSKEQYRFIKDENYSNFSW